MTMRTTFSPQFFEVGAHVINFASIAYAEDHQLEGSDDENTLVYFSGRNDPLVLSGEDQEIFWSAIRRFIEEDNDPSLLAVRQRRA